MALCVRGLRARAGFARQGVMSWTQFRCAGGIAIAQAGEPKSALKWTEFTVPTAKPGQVVVEMLAAPVTITDINTFKSKSTQSFGGSQGVGKIVEVGSGVNDFKTGDIVVPIKSNLGTWRTHAEFPSTSIFKISDKIPVEYASTLYPHLPTAISLLQAIQPLKEGDVVVQNVANSTVGQFVIQICAQHGIKTVNIVTPRPRDGDLRERLKTLGGDIVVTSDYVMTEGMRNVMSTSRGPILGLDGAGGRDAGLVGALLGKNATLVSYAQLSGKPVPALPQQLFDQGLKLVNFDFEAYFGALPKAQQSELLQLARSVLEDGQLNLYVERHGFGKDFLESVLYSQERFRERKLVFVMGDF